MPIIGMRTGDTDQSSLEHATLIGDTLSPPLLHLTTKRYRCIFSFHLSGLSSSHELSLHSEAGFQSVVRHMVGILYISDEEAFGLDKTPSGDVYRINNRDYEIVRPIDVCICMRGPATAVHGIRGTRDTPPRSRWLTLPDEVTELPEKMVYELSY
ncbi:hypothetical protein EDB87DRAFT_526921 [Lactarius vividus]|nr:hypothetical protein EDB87DRAFT_526921 [Lactarius vividus]